MKAYTINCPSCGANVNLEKDVPRCFCPYCGTQIIVDDGVQRSEVVYRDEAKILELQLQEQARLRAIEEETKRKAEEENSKKRQNHRFLIAVFTYFFISLLSGIIIRIYYMITKNDISDSPVVVLFCVIPLLSPIVAFYFPYGKSRGRNILIAFLLCFLLMFWGYVCFFAPISKLL